MLRILIADDVPMVRAGLKMLLEMHKGWSVCGEATDGKDAVEKALALAPDVILLDMGIPAGGGLAVLNWLSLRPETRLATSGGTDWHPSI